MVVSTCVIVWLILSAAPLAWAWKGDDIPALICIRWQRDLSIEEHFADSATAAKVGKAAKHVHCGGDVGVHGSVPR